MPGFTHSKANNFLFSLFDVLFEMFEDKKRAKQLLENINECPLGSGALAGTNFCEISREFLAKDLGLLNQLKILLIVFQTEILQLNFLACCLY